MLSIPFRVVLLSGALLAGIATSFSVFAQNDAAAGSSGAATAERYDRLDGTGDSHKRVDVIEWEGNLEVHVYPKTSTQGLGAKLDTRDQSKKVMVIAYRFDKTSKPLVRRAILGIPFNAKLQAFIDPTEKDFDKLALSNQTLSAPWKPYKLDAAPKQWYPDGDPRNDEEAAPAKTPLTAAPSDDRAPQAKGSPVKRIPASQDASQDEDGAIKNYSW